jgi:translation elongation factor IF5A
MAFKLINAVEARPGAAIIVDDVSCIVKSNDISKTGKHGHAKCRIEAIGIIDGKKKVFVTGGHERLDVPLINKNKGQVLNITGDTASIMDLTSYETIDGVPIMPDVKEAGLAEEDQVEYWDIEGTKVIKRKM